MNEPQPALAWDEDGNQFNAWLYEGQRGETWQDFRHNRWTSQQRFASVSAAALLSERSDAPFPTIYPCAWSALEHYLDHAAGVRCTLQCQLPEARLSFHGSYTDESCLSWCKRISRHPL